MPIELPLARSVAERFHTQFPDTDAAAITEMIVAAFWASLRREEGFTPNISLAYLCPEKSVDPILFDRRLPLNPASLARLSPAVERPGIHLGVSREAGQLSVWGATRGLPADCFVLEVIAPGLLVIKQRGEDDDAKFANIAVFEGDQVKILDSTTAPPDSPPIVATLLGFDDGAASLIELAVSMRQHRRGGALLIVPAGKEDWRASIVDPISYAVLPGACTDDIETIAGLTAVDGATIITSRNELLGFGAKITRREGFPRVDQISVSELIEGAEVQVMHPTQLGGTRHLSAAQFVQDQRDAVAHVASQDGRFTVFAWSRMREMVHAFRIEAFLL